MKPCLQGLTAQRFGAWEAEPNVALVESLRSVESIPPAAVLRPRSAQASSLPVSPAALAEQDAPGLLEARHGVGLRVAALAQWVPPAARGEPESVQIRPFFRHFRVKQAGAESPRATAMRHE